MFITIVLSLFSVMSKHTNNILCSGQLGMLSNNKLYDWQHQYSQNMSSNTVINKISRMKVTDTQLL